MDKISNYFDYAAATPLLPEVLVAMQPFLTDQFYNPAALYLAAQSNRRVLESARQNIASGLGARPTEIIFTAGGTEANNMALFGVFSKYPQGHLVTTAIEHDSILKPAKRYAHTTIEVDEKGLVDVEAIKNAITDKTVLVSVMYANNEVGAIQPIKKIAEMIDIVRNERRIRDSNLPIYLHTDACQASNYLDMHVARLGIDLMTINAGKIYGPKQCGALYVRAGLTINPLISGGGQEWNMRSGTENLANIVGFAAAWEKVRGDYRDETYRLSKLRDTFVQYIETLLSSGVRVNGPRGARRLANNIHLTFPGIDNERLLMELDEQGFQVATGSACSASSDEPSHVLGAMGMSDKDAHSSIRITLGRYTNDDSLRDLSLSIVKIVSGKK